MAQQRKDIYGAIQYRAIALMCIDSAMANERDKTIRRELAGTREWLKSVETGTPEAKRESIRGHRERFPRP